MNITAKKVRQAKALRASTIICYGKPERGGGNPGGRRHKPMATTHKPTRDTHRVREGQDRELRQRPQAVHLGGGCVVGA